MTSQPHSSVRVSGRELRPGWAPGVELRQTSLDCVQVVGDVANPLALRGLSSAGLDWLRQIDGERSWDAQLAEAQAHGLAAGDAQLLLRQLFEAQLLVDVRDRAEQHPFASSVVVGSAKLGARIAGLVPGAQFVGSVPKPRDGEGWRLASEALADQVGATASILALDAPWIDAAELEFVGRLIDSQVDHLVVGAGATSVRVGPLTFARGGPCVRCDELLRTGLDPSWRQLSAQLALDDASVSDEGLMVLAAAEAARQIANAAPQGEVAALNAVLTTGRRGGAWRRRPLERHLRCSCWWSALAGD